MFRGVPEAPNALAKSPVRRISNLIKRVVHESLNFRRTYESSLIRNKNILEGMKNIRLKLIKLFKQGYCTPQISRIAKAVNEPSTTIHYNIKKLQDEGAIKAYKAVFDHKKIDEGFCAYVLIKLDPERFDTPVAEDMAKIQEVESAATITGQWDVILKVRAKDQDEYYDILKKAISKKGVRDTLTLVTLKDIKTDFVFL